MNKAVLTSMTDAERLLVVETERAATALLDEDELLDLHARIRRARSKYVKNYRRGASAEVGAASSRGAAYARSQRDRDKAEVFELALARVSREVGRIASRAAADLKAERLAAARDGSGAAGPARSAASSGAAATPATPKRGATKTTGGTKRDASTRAQGARRQARSDAR